MNTKDIFCEVVCNYNNDEGFWTVDAWCTPDENEETGEVIAAIHEKTGDVFYVNQMARTSAKAQEVITQKVSEIKAANRKVTAYTLFGQDAVKAYENSLADIEKGERCELLRKVLTCDNDLRERSFASEDEKRAYYRGIDDYDGWWDATSVSKEDYDTLKELMEEE